MTASSWSLSAMFPGVTSDQPSEVSNGYSTSNYGTLSGENKRTVSSKIKLTIKDSEMDIQKIYF